MDGRLSAPCLGLQIGGNDLCDGAVQAWTVGDRVVQLARECIRCHGVVEVVFCTAFAGVVCPPTLPAYPSRVVQLNRWVKVMVEGEGSITYWRHPRTFAAPDIMHRDGVHLNVRGHLKMYRGLRSLLIKTVKRLSVR